MARIGWIVRMLVLAHSGRADRARRRLLL